MKQSQLFDLISSGRAQWNGNDVSSEISWRIVRFYGGTMPFSYFRSEIVGFESSAAGTGVSFNSRDAAKKAFCESWERLCIRHFCPDSNSDGFAAGSSVEDAMRRSREEKIERAVMLKAWSDQVGWKKIPFTSFKARLLVFIYRLQGWKIDLFQLSSNVGQVLACLFRHNENGAIFDCAYVTDEDNETKLLLSNLRTVYLPDEKEILELPVQGVPSDHRRFYRSTRNLEAFDFLNDQGGNEETLILPNPEKLTTTVIVGESNFPAVCRSSHPTWPELLWGVQSIKGKNKWPHPLA